MRLVSTYDLADQQIGSEGPALVFLHGIAGSGRYWAPRIMPLAKSFRLFMPDLLGFGRSPWPEAQYTIALHVSTVRQYLARVGLDGEPITIVGHSLGSILALEYAARFPGNVQSLVLFNLPCYENAHEARRFIAREGGLHAATVTFRPLAHFL